MSRLQEVNFRKVAFPNDDDFFRKRHGRRPIILRVERLCFKYRANLGRKRGARSA